MPPPTMSIAHGDSSPVWWKTTFGFKVWASSRAHCRHVEMQHGLECDGCNHAQGTPLYMAFECGGGEFAASMHGILAEPMPCMMSGANHMGWAFEGFVHGSTLVSCKLDGCGCSWDPSWGMELWTGEVPSSLSGRRMEWCRCEHPVFASDPDRDLPSPAAPVAAEISALWTVEFVGSGTSRQSASTALPRSSNNPECPTLKRTPWPPPSSWWRVLRPWMWKCTSTTGI